MAQVFIDDSAAADPGDGARRSTGFFAPVDHPDTVNKVKAGQTIPMKWKMESDAADDLGGLLPVQR